MGLRRAYSLPWQAGITGIAYNPALTGRELRSIMDLFDPAFKGRVAMLTEMRDTSGSSCSASGLDPSVVDEDGANQALDLIEQATDDGQIRAFTGNEYLRSLESGDFVACVAWSGDVVQLQYDRPDIQFVIPEEGGMSWYDTMVIPKGAPNALRRGRLDELRLRPGAGGPAHGVGAVRDAGEGGPRRARARWAATPPLLADSPILFPAAEDARPARAPSPTSPTTSTPP